MRRSAFPFLALVAFLLALPLVSLVPVSPTAAARNQSGCRTEPLSPQRLRAVVGGIPSPLSVPASAPRPHPYPSASLPGVDDQTFHAIHGAMLEAAACAAAGNAARLYALYTEDFLRRTIDAAEAPTDDSGLPRPPVWRGSWLLEDGRVGTVYSEPQPSAEPPIYYVFVKNGDRWLIDDAIPFAPEADGTERTSS